MGKEILKKLLSSLEAVGATVTDNRREKYDKKYVIGDAIKSAFAVFFFQHPSLLSFQRAMKERTKRNNVETLLGVTGIPSDNKIRDLLDRIEPAKFSGAFDKNLKVLDKYDALDQFRVLDGGVLLALDGVWYFSSQEIHCKHCLHKTKDGITTYYHSVLAGTIVKPGGNAVLPVMPEMITNEDGTEKQDCELKAAKRWLTNHGAEYKWLTPTILGDDLFSNYPMCKAILDQGMSFILTCKPASHPWLTDTVNNARLDESEKREWTGRNHLIFRYKWLNGVDIRDNKETLPVNYLSLEITNVEKGKVTYKNSWITNKSITGDNVQLLVSCAKARWKIENEHNNVLKNHGYNLEHNFGHGQEYASEIFCLLNLLAFQFHTILDVCDELYKKVRLSAGRRDEFCNILRAALRLALHDSWETYLLFALGPDFDVPSG
jgi:hypothetical protein